MRLRSILAMTCVCLVAIGLLSCSDVPSTAPEFPDFRTMTRFINAASDVGDVEIILQPTVGADFTSFGTVPFQENTPYMDIPAGNRIAAIRVGGATVDTTNFSLSSDGKITVLVLPKASDMDSRFAVFLERRMFDPLPSATGQVRFISAALDTVNFAIVNTAADTVVASNLSLADKSGYLNFEAGSFTFGVTVSGTDSVLGTVQVSVSNGQRHTAIIFGDQANLSFKSFQDDPQ